MNLQKCIGKNFTKKCIRKNFSQQNVKEILLTSAFPYCGLGRCVVVSEGFLKILSPHSYVGSVRFFPKSIVPAVKTQIPLYLAIKIRIEILI